LILATGTVLLAGIIAKVTYGRFTATQSVHQPNIKRVVKEQGWEIIGLKQSSVVEPRHIFEGYGEKPAQIYATAFRPNQEVVTEVPLYRLLEGGEVLAIKEQSISIRSIVRYDVHEKVFCYFVRGVGAFYDKKSGYGGYGGEYGFLYYDNDGDGKFENFEIGGHIPPFVPQVPEWVLK
jgi:hypothetical protein